jgi:hypothetical protein
VLEGQHGREAAARAGGAGHARAGAAGRTYTGTPYEGETVNVLTPLEPREDDEFEPADDGANVDPDDGFNYTAMPEEDIEDAPAAVR